MKTILIADPDPYIRKSLMLLLQHRLGLKNIHESRDLLSFALSMAGCAPRLLLFDPVLYDMTALEACLLLQQTYPALKLILLSTNVEDALAAQTAGVGFIHKGDNPEKLIGALTPWLKEQNDPTCEPSSPQPTISEETVS